MPKQNSGSGAGWTAIRNELTKLESQPEFRLILDSQANFAIEDQTEAEYHNAIEWLIMSLRKAHLRSWIEIDTGKISAEDSKKIKFLVDEIYNGIFNNTGQIFVSGKQVLKHYGATGHLKVIK